MFKQREIETVETERRTPSWSGASFTRKVSLEDAHLWNVSQNGVQLSGKTQHRERGHPGTIAELWSQSRQRT